MKHLYAHIQIYQLSRLYCSKKNPIRTFKRAFECLNSKCIELDFCLFM